MSLSLFFSHSFSCSRYHGFAEFRLTGVYHGTNVISKKHNASQPSRMANSKCHNCMFHGECVCRHLKNCFHFVSDVDAFLAQAPNSHGSFGFPFHVDMTGLIFLSSFKNQAKILYALKSNSSSVAVEKKRTKIASENKKKAEVSLLSLVNGLYVRANWSTENEWRKVQMINPENSWKFMEIVKRTKPNQTKAKPSKLGKDCKWREILKHNVRLIVYAKVFCHHSKISANSMLLNNLKSYKSKMSCNHS